MNLIFSDKGLFVVNKLCDLFKFAQLYILKHKTSLIGENLSRLVLNHHLHVLDTLAPGADLVAHGCQLLSVKNSWLHPGQHDTLINLHSQNKAIYIKSETDIC